MPVEIPPTTSFEFPRMEMGELDVPEAPTNGLSWLWANAGYANVDWLLSDLQRPRVSHADNFVANPRATSKGGCAFHRRGLRLELSLLNHFCKSLSCSGLISVSLLGKFIKALLAILLDEASSIRLTLCSLRYDDIAGPWNEEFWCLSL